MRLRLFLNMLLLIWLVACQSARPAPGLPSLVQAPAATPVAGAAQLSIIVDPPGARVAIDGELAGASPLTLTLSAGMHQMSVDAAGFAPLAEAITLTAGQQGIYAPALADVEAPKVTLTADPSQVPWSGNSTLQATATDNLGVVAMQVSANGQLLADGQDGDLTLDLAPADTGFMAPGGVYTLTARASDAAGNVGEASLVLTVLGEGGPGGVATTGPATSVSATASPLPVPPGAAVPTLAPVPAAQPTAGTDATATSPALAGQTSYSVGSIVIPTYPYTRYLSTVTDPSTANSPVLVLDRTAYDASRLRPVNVSYTLITLENRYLRLTILPDLGGRIYECVFKPTGNDEFYRNPVIKPTAWGPPGTVYPAGANWWLAAGGLEWGFPVEEHGYEWGKAWGYDFVTNDDGSVSATVFMHDYRRPYVAVTITLPPDSAAFSVQPLIVNPLGAPFRFKWWDNAMLAPGAANKPGPDLRFIIPGSEVTVHSAGNKSVPAAGQVMSWPVYNGRDMSRLGNWSSWLGFFARPAAQAGFAGVYDTAADEGVVRVFPPDVVRGVKGFAAGWSQPIDPGAWTDDGSGYVELHGGLAPTFDDWNELPPGGQAAWTETWFPAAGIGGVSYAAEGGAVNIARRSGGLQVAVFPTKAVAGTLTIGVPGATAISRAVRIDPAHPFAETVPSAGQGEVTVTLTDAAGQTVLAYRGRP